jgi:hypothetical protein
LVFFFVDKFEVFHTDHLVKGLLFSDFVSDKPENMNFTFYTLGQVWFVFVCPIYIDVYKYGKFSVNKFITFGARNLHTIVVGGGGDWGSDCE